MALTSGDWAGHNHPVEWWYLNGVFSDNHNNKYSFSGVIFKILAPEYTPLFLSKVYPDPVFIGHFGLFDFQSQVFRSIEVGSHPFIPKDVRIQNCHCDSVALNITAGTWFLRRNSSGMLSARFDFLPRDTVTPNILELELITSKATAFHGSGYIGTPATGRIYYMSNTKMKLQGTLNDVPVIGEAWLDHQWGGNDSGHFNDIIYEPRWDWFSLMLQSDREIMVYRMRGFDGQILDQGASIVEKNGHTHFDPNVVINHTETFKGPSQTSYPWKWTIQLSSGERFIIQPNSDGQEIDAVQILGHTYFEASTTISGDDIGHGFMELVGHGKTFNVFKRPIEWIARQFKR